MSIHLKHLHNLKNIFLKSVEAVKPKNLLSAGNNYILEPRLEDGKTCIQVQGKCVDITNKKCHLVGFGKAVLGMAVQLEKSLGPLLVRGILSIPKGSRQQFRNAEEMSFCAMSLIKIYEGAEQNQPDENALQAAMEIQKLAESLREEDILFVLISGGGSSLLPLPKPPLKLHEKMLLIKKLSNCGASIQEMNIVRIALSAIKGGNLAMAASQAHAIISFVISDIVGDPVDLIASGPTSAAKLNTNQKAEDILKKFNLWQELEDHIKILVQSENKVEVQKLKNNFIFVIGDNRVATLAAEHEALQLNYNPFIVSTTIQGEVSSLAFLYCDFLKKIYDFKEDLISQQELSKNFPFESRMFEHFLKTLNMCEKTEKPLLLIMAGEPTVKVLGCGVGGRNQELALRLSREFYKQPRLKNVCFLSAGTDGIDGPCLAAGAVASSQIVLEFLSKDAKTLQNLNEFIDNNDSYNFYANLNQGEYHVVTGHTGTNVMDLHLLLVL